MKKKSKQIWKWMIAGALSAAMILTMLPVNELETQAESTTLKNPIIVEDNSMYYGQKVTWDCVWFGRYPQTEIVAKASQCGTYGNEYWGSEEDYEVDENLYAKLQSATYDSNGDTTVNGMKYRRMKKADAVYSEESSSTYYNWSDSSSYHFFRYDPIKWRVISIDGNSAFLLADRVLDEQIYNLESSVVTWETSMIRSWLNGYETDDDKNVYGSKNFMNRAFSSVEQAAIKTTNVENKNNLMYGIDGGNNTSDKLFLLSESEIYSTDVAESYGFLKEGNKYDQARRSKSTTYAKAMGAFAAAYSNPTGAVSTLDNGNCYWWLRSPDYDGNSAIYVSCDGFTYDYIYNVHEHSNGVRPALNLDLSSDLWSYAGTVCSNETVNEIAPSEGDRSHQIDMSKDVWSFGNFSGCEEKYWKLWFPQLQAKELSKYVKQAKEGLCYGMVMTAITLNSKDQSPMDFSTENVSDIQKNSISKALRISASDYIRYMFPLQISSYIHESYSHDLNELYNDVKAFERGENDGVEIAVYGKYWFENHAGHSLWGVRTIDEDQQSKIVVYDCNHPNEEKFIILDKDENGKFVSWKYDTELFGASMFGTGQKGEPEIKYIAWSGTFFESLTKKLNGVIQSFSPGSTDRNLVALTSGNLPDESLDPIELCGLIEQTKEEAEEAMSTSKYYWSNDNQIEVMGDEKGIEASVIGSTSSVELISKYGEKAVFSLQEKDDICLDTQNGDEITLTFKNVNEDDDIKWIQMEGIAGKESIQAASNQNGIIINGMSSISIVSDQQSASAKDLNTEHDYCVLVDDNKTSIKEDTNHDGVFDQIIFSSLVKTSKITVSGLSKQIAAGKKMKLIASVLPTNASDKAVTWKSSNTKVATVSSSGVVTMKKGTGGKSVTITATAKDGSGVSASWKIKSMKGVVKKVSISGSKSVKAGKSLKLKAKVSASKGANKKVKWTSSNTKYAKVSSSGKVTTYKAGKGKKVKITVTATDGSNKKKTVTIKIK